MGFVLAAWGGPGMITKDFANHAVQLYLSRPISRTEYLLGKVSVLVALLSCTTWIPALLLFFLKAELQGHGWLWENLWMAGSIILGCLIWIAVITLISMAVAVWVKWRIAATALMLGIFFLLPAAGSESWMRFCGHNGAICSTLPTSLRWSGCASFGRSRLSFPPAI